MSRVQKLLKNLQSRWSAHVPHIAEIADYVRTGNPKALAKIKKPAGRSWVYTGPITDALAPPDEMGEEHLRALKALCRLDAGGDAGMWLEPYLEREKPGEDLHRFLRDACEGLPSETAQIVAVTVDRLPLFNREGEPNSAGRYLLSLSDRDLASGLKRTPFDEGVVNVVRLLLSHAPDRVAAVSEPLILREEGKKRVVRWEVAVELLGKTGKTYEKPILAAWEAMAPDGEKFLSGTELAKVRPRQYRDKTRRLGLELLPRKKGDFDERFVCEWLVQNYGTKDLETVSNYLRTAQPWMGTEILDATVAVLGKEGLPAVLALHANPKAEAHVCALKHLVSFKDPDLDEIILESFRQGLTGAEELMEYVSLAGKWDVARLEGLLWDLLSHKSKPVRAACARLLGRLGDPIVPKAAELLGERKAATRMVAVEMLVAADTDSAVNTLESHLDEEADEDTRDRILLGLETAWEARGKKITKKTIQTRMERAAEHLNKPPASWIKFDALPELKVGRGKLDPQMVRYLLYRQSRAKEIRPDVEAKPVYAMIDRATSGDFALAVLKGFLGSKMVPDDRWAMAVAGLLGDDRVVPLLTAQIRTWADNARGKMSEYAVHALALLGTDAALSAVNALSIRYRSKYKNIGKAAVEAFSAAAEAQGITPDELGDRVVPWLGFEPDKPRVLELGGRRLEVRVGLDFRVAFWDLDKNKRVASLPKSATKETAVEIKELKENLREVIKGQVTRLENLLVRQHRWPVGRWRELFLGHPVLFPFAVRLVWGCYDGQGGPAATFRAIEDRTLTDVNDESCVLPESGEVGIVHPLELDEETRQSWRNHLADYEIEPPFPQLERRIVRLEPKDRDRKVSKDLTGTQINAMTFKGRAERLGWQRGSVVDAGGISTYMKSFPGAGVDVLLALDGMYIGIDMSEDIKLGNLYFTSGGSVEIGSYVYDEPANESDPRVMAFGDVPPIVYSEVMGDLVKIAGEKADDQA